MIRIAALLLLAALATAGDDVSTLVGKLEAEQATERHAAARALRRQGPSARAAVPALLGLLSDAEPWVRVEAARAVAAIGLDKAHLRAFRRTLARAEYEVGQLLADALAGLGADAMPTVLDLLDGKRSAARTYALLAVGRMGEPGAEAVGSLLQLLADDDAATRTLAGEALSRVGPWAEDHVAAIVDHLKFGPPPVRLAAARILALIGPAAKDALPALRDARAGGDETLKQAAAEALALIDVAPKEKKRHPALRQPALATLKAPSSFRVTFETTRGAFELELYRDWAPLAVDRFYNLAKIGFFDDTSFYRAMKGFVVQFGLNGDSRVNGVWANRNFEHDPRTQSNVRGTIAFAQGDEPKTRATQVFVNLTDNTQLDKAGFTPFGRVVDGMDVVDKLYSGYGDGPPRGTGPDQRSIITLGDEYLRRQFPRLDRITKVTVAKK